MPTCPSLYDNWQNTQRRPRMLQSTQRNTQYIYGPTTAGITCCRSLETSGRPTQFGQYSGWLWLQWPGFDFQIQAMSSLLLLIKRYNLFEVLACSTTFFHLSLSCATFFKLCTFIFFISSKTSSSHRSLCLPVGLLAMGFHLLIFFTLLSSVMRSTWPNQNVIYRV